MAGREDYLEMLSQRGWYRSRDRWDLPPAGQTQTTGPITVEDLDNDPVAERLRKMIYVYDHGSLLNWEIRCRVRAVKDFTDEQWERIYYAEESGPRVYFQSELSRDLLYDFRGQGREVIDVPEGWPKTEKELTEHLEAIVPLFQQKTQRFLDMVSAAWFDERGITPSSREDTCYKDAYLHAEVWKCEREEEEPVWVFAALRPGKRVPDYDIETSVYDNVVYRRERERTWLFERLHEIDLILNCENYMGVWPGEDDEEEIDPDLRRERLKRDIKEFGQDEYNDRRDNPEKYEVPEER